MKKLLYILLFVPFALFGQQNNSLSFNESEKLNNIRNGQMPFLLQDSIKLYFEQKEKSLPTKVIQDSIEKVLQTVTLNPDNHLPYPILFVHGLAGDSHTWLEMTEWLETALGETVKLDFSLNSDGNLFYSNMLYDVQSFVPDNLTSANLYKITFNCNSLGDCFYGGSTSSNYSNQAGIKKQGKAIGIAVNAILESTGKSKIILVGHSMGGLAIREYLQNNIHWIDESHRVAKLVTVGTPNCGSDLEYGGIDWMVSDLGLVDIRATSEAVRDLRSQYDYFGFAATSGAFIWGGFESQSYMDDNIISSWDNVDVTCNGSINETVLGINERSITSYIEYASIRDYNDDVVSPSTVDWNWPDEETGCEDLCSVLSYWSGENIHCENWNIDALGFMGGHSDLPGELKENLWALDEPDGGNLNDFHTRYRAYEVNFDINYAGFVTPQGHNMSYNLDVDNYRVFIPADGVLEIDVSFLEGSEGDEFFLWEENTGTYINSINNVSENELISSEVSEGYYFIQFYGNETEEEQYSQYFFSLNFSLYGCTDVLACNFNPDAEINDDTCVYPEEYYNCDGSCINDFDFDGECDEFDFDDGLGLDNIKLMSPQLIKMVDVLGRVQNQHNKGELLFYIYDNGKVEKKFNL
tara:strand:+ start:223 stop:2133 length:1911 start_codon:yes stop_codon:yes gene_type:complete